MKARIGSWRIDVDITRNLSEDPHTVDVTVDARGLDGHVVAELNLRAGDAAHLATFLDELQHGLDRASEADECDLCGMPCDPGEAECPRCQDAEVRR